MEYDRAYFRDKVCAVTGAASGIGLALCEELLESGARRVAMADYNQANLDKHAKRLADRYPGKVKGILCNVTIENDVSRMVDAAAAFGGGRLDLLVNCAGAAFAGMFVDLESVLAGNGAGKASANDDWQKSFSLNYFGAVYGCRAALRHMLAQKSGQVVNIISGIAFAAMAYQSMYAATKAALWAFTQALRYEFWDCGIRFSAATPGTTATAIFGGEAPPEAQSPRQSAQRILHGAALNERLIMGDDADLSGGINACVPDDGGTLMDLLLLAYARQRRGGTVSFAVPKEVSEAIGDPDRMPECVKLCALPMNEAWEAANAYVARRGFPAPDKAYYEGKTAAVAGDAHGVGLKLCEKLLEYGASKVVFAACDGAPLEKQAAQLAQRYPGRVKSVCRDMSREDEARGTIEEARAFFGGRLDLLINIPDAERAGLFALPPGEHAGRRAEANEAWERVFGAGFFGPLYATRAALPIMAAQGGGQIVNVISAEAFAPSPYRQIEASVKAALNQLTQALRYEFWDANVKINSAAPGGEQPPERAAERILAGVAKNERLICGDENDLLSALFAFNVNANQKIDETFAAAARVSPARP